MRATLTSLTVLAAIFSVSACGDPKGPDATPQTTAADTAAEQSAVMPEDAPPQEEAETAMTPADSAGSVSSDGASCLSELGAAASARLVERCIAVSPATHPPCNKANPCALIRDEIDRSCAMYGPGEAKPAECAG